MSRALALIAGGDHDSVFAHHPTAIHAADGQLTVTHRGVAIGTFSAPPAEPQDSGRPARELRRSEPLPSAELARAARRILEIEREQSDRRSSERPGASGCGGDDLAASRWRTRQRGLLRAALNVLDFNESIELRDLLTAGRDNDAVARVRAIACGSLRHRRLDKALAAKTIEFAGVTALRDALTNRAARHRQQPGEPLAA